jgi:hypothetical protein
MSAFHKQEISEIRKGNDALVPKFDWLSETVTETINCYGQIKQAIRECQGRYQQLKINCGTGMKDKGKTT